MGLWLIKKLVLTLVVLGHRGGCLLVFLGCWWCVLFLVSLFLRWWFSVFHLSLVPLSTRWIDDSGFAQIPVFIYGLNLLLAALAFSVLTHTVRRSQGPEGAIKKAFEGTMKWKNPITLSLYVGGMLLTMVNPLIGFVAFILAALIWLVPERRIEQYIAPN